MATGGAASSAGLARTVSLGGKGGAAMTKRLYYCLWALAAALFAADVRAAADDSANGPARPNILFILCDDLGINDLHCYGRQDHHTPNLDRLAQQGMRFTSAYCAQPICSPSRAAILTGKTPGAPAPDHVSARPPQCGLAEGAAPGNRDAGAARREDDLRVSQGGRLRDRRHRQVARRRAEDSGRWSTASTCTMPARPTPRPRQPKGARANTT